jgi:hypothetical protein
MSKCHVLCCFASGVRIPRFRTPSNGRRCEQPYPGSGSWFLNPQPSPFPSSCDLILAPSPLSRRTTALPAVGTAADEVPGGGREAPPLAPLAPHDQRSHRTCQFTIPRPPYPSKGVGFFWAGQLLRSQKTYPPVRMDSSVAVTTQSEWTLPWLLPRSQNGLFRGCYHAVRMDSSVAVTTQSEWTLPWLLPRSQNGLFRGCYHAVRMDSSVAVTTQSEWTLPWLLPRSQNGLFRGCYHAVRMDSFVAVTTPWLLPRSLQDGILCRRLSGIL